ncbi:hypothetical protein TNCV_4725071 [Trichonephila clavipes]|uniref:Uncharacterized protein n=1 Tax=Trichonephila clavipes TaxID=2585209 RepID=A0A8X6W772_TRICX|nr:hypothetical protein TNCV_4725071 [Trichonephila clavipes]
MPAMIRYFDHWATAARQKLEKHWLTGEDVKYANMTECDPDVAQDPDSVQAVKSVLLRGKTQEASSVVEDAKTVEKSTAVG